MVGSFPPSSPVAASGSAFGQHLHRESSTDDISIEPLNNNYMTKFSVNKPALYKVQSTCDDRSQYGLKGSKIQFPTPQASSSTGRSSSPIRAGAVESRPSSSPSFSAALSPSSPHVISQEISSTVGTDWINIELDSRNCSRLAIGRKKSVCDIVLPSKKNISRQHAFITYFPVENLLKLECNGTNGLVIELPCGINCKLMKKDSTKGSYQLSAADAGNEESFAQNGNLEKRRNALSFVLLKGEKVVMPFIAGTLIDFRQAEAILTLKQDDCPVDADDNSTETEDEREALFTKSDDFHEGSNTPERFITVATSPSTLKLSEEMIPKNPPSSPSYNAASNTTPITSNPPQLFTKFQATPLKLFDIQTPATPKKIKQLNTRINESYEAQDTPISKNRKVESLSKPLLLHRPRNDLSVEKPDEQKRKQRKKITNKDAKTKDPFEALEERGIDCSELQNVLANHLAFANVQQTPLFQLLQVNSKTSTTSRQELRALLAREPCIGVIYREGKDAAGKPLDEEYFYDVENDSNEERRNLVTSLKGGRSGLRSCRRTHKQYFWKKPAK